MAKNKVEIILQGIDRVTPSVRSVSSAFGKIGGSITALRSHFFTLSIAMAGIAFAFKRMISPVQNFEKELINVQKTTNLSSVQVAKLGDKLKDIGPQLGVGAAQLAQIAAVGGQLGIQTAPEIEKFTDTIAKISLVTDLAAEEAATAFAKISNALGSPISEVDRLASVVNELENTTAAKTREILSAMQRMASGARLLRVSSTDVAALGASIVEAGFAGERGGTILNRVFTQMATNADEIAKVVGESTQQIQERINKDAIKTLVDLIDFINKIPGEAQKLSVISDIFGEIGLKGFGVLASNVDKFRQNLSTARREAEENTSLMRELDIFMGSLSKKFEQLGVVWSNAFIDLGKGVEGPLKEFLDGMREELPLINEDFKDLGIAIGNFISKIDPKKVVAFIKALIELAVKVTDLTVVMSETFMPILEEVFGFMNKALHVALDLWGKLVGFIDKALQKTKGFFSGQEAEAATIPGGAGAGFGSFGSGQGTADSPIGLGTIQIPVGKEQIGELESNVESAVENIGEKFGDLTEEVGAGFQQMTGFASGFTQGVNQFMDDMKARWGEGFGTMTNFAMNFSLQAAHALANNLGSAIKNIILNTENASEAWKEFGKNLVGVLVEFVVQYGAQLLIAKAFSLVFKGFITSVATSIANAWLPAAVFATIATLGAAAIQAPITIGGAIGATLGLTKGISALSGGGGGGSNAGGASEGALQLTPFAEGGIVTRPTAALIGEGGEPEAVIPLSKAGGFGGTNININIDRADISSGENIEEFAEELMEQIGRLMEQKRLMPASFT